MKTKILFTALFLSTYLFSFASKNDGKNKNYGDPSLQVFKVTFAKIDNEITLKQALGSVETINIVKFCADKNYYLCTIDATRYTTLTSVNNAVGMKVGNMEKFFVTLLTPADINSDCQ